MLKKFVELSCLRGPILCDMDIFGTRDDFYRRLQVTLTNNFSYQFDTDFCYKLGQYATHDQFRREFNNSDRFNSKSSLIEGEVIK